MRENLQGKVAIVTGSARRVGRAIAIELARAGVNILVHYHETPEEEARNTLKDVKSFGVNAWLVQADLSKPEGVNQLFSEARTCFPDLHILVNSASNFQRRGLMQVTLEDWQNTLAINLTAPFLCTQAAVRWMQEHAPNEHGDQGVIINICDKGSLEPWVDFAHHGVSKAGLLALSQVTAASLGPSIRANAIIPGLVMKPDGMDETRWQTFAQDSPAKRPGSASDIGRAVVYLAGEDFISGAVLRVDGGESLL